MAAVSKEERRTKRKEDFKNSAFGKFLDKCFYKTVTVDLSDAQDGSTVKSIRKPRMTKVILITLAVLLIVIGSFFMFNYENTVKFNWKMFWQNFGALFIPVESRTGNAAGWWKFAWNSFAIGINSTLIKSMPFVHIFSINFIATVLGGLVAIPIYYLCANNVNHNKWIRVPVKVFNDFIRCIPMFVLCVIFAMLFSKGSALPAIIAVAIFSMGVTYQMMYEYLETLNMKPVESIRSAGANSMQGVWIALHPEVKPMFVAYWIYTLEINIRASVILSYVGLQSSYMNALQIFIQNSYYDYIGAMLLPLFFVVALLQFVSNTLVRKLR